MLELNHVWTSTGSSGAIGLSGVYLAAGCLSAALYCESSTLGSTQSFALQTAQSSGGPWFTEGSTSIGATATLTGQAQIRISGSFLWARPYLNSASTGNYTFRLIANS